MNDFRVSLQALRHGWATIKFESNVQELVYVVSYISADALSALADSALMAMQNKPYQTRFYLEPEYLPYEVTPCDDEIDILVGDTHFSCGLRRYARQILKMFDSYLFSHSIEEYAAQWHCDYPEEAVEQLREQLRRIT